MHIHFSLFKNGKNIFVDPEDPTRLSEEAYYFIGGLLAHSREMTLITNPLVNSYKRLVPGFDAPTELTWTRNNQNSLVRIPRVNGADTRIELRSPDAATHTLFLRYAWQRAWMESRRRSILQKLLTVLFPSRIRRNRVSRIYRRTCGKRSHCLRTAAG